MDLLAAHGIIGHSHGDAARQVGHLNLSVVRPPNWVRWNAVLHADDEAGGGATGEHIVERFVDVVECPLLRHHTGTPGRV